MLIGEVMPYQQPKDIGGGIGYQHGIQPVWITDPYTQQLEKAECDSVAKLDISGSYTAQQYGVVCLVG